MKNSTVIVCLIFLLASQALAVEPNSLSKVQQWCYDCSLFCFGSVASLQLSIAPTELPQTYRLVLQGKAKGLIGWLNGDRYQYYESLVRLDSDSTVTTLSSLQQTEITHNSSRIKYGWRFTFSELNPAVKGERLWGGRVVETADYSQVKVDQNSNRVVGDFLSALFNFMMDSTHPLEVGLHYDYLVFYLDDYVAVSIEVIDCHDPNSWQCRVRSQSACLPGGGNEMIFYCNDDRVPLTAQSAAVLGRVYVRGMRCVGE